MELFRHLKGHRMAPCNKQSYRSLGAANYALGEINRHKVIGGKRLDHAYPCARCHLWHHTSKRQTGKRPRWMKAPTRA